MRFKYFDTIIHENRHKVTSNPIIRRIFSFMKEEQYLYRNETLQTYDSSVARIDFNCMFPLPKFMLVLVLSEERYDMMPISTPGGEFICLRDRVSGVTLIDSDAQHGEWEYIEYVCDRDGYTTMYDIDAKFILNHLFTRDGWYSHPVKNEYVPLSISDIKDTGKRSSYLYLCGQASSILTDILLKYPPLRQLEVNMHLYTDCTISYH